MNLILQSNDCDMRAMFFQLAPAWRLLDSNVGQDETDVIVVDLRGAVDDIWKMGFSRWIALGDTPQHFRWASEHGAALFLMWPCNRQQLECALRVAANWVAPDNSVISWSGGISWNRKTATITKGRHPVNLTPIETDILSVLWTRHEIYTSTTEILKFVWRGSVATEQNVYVYIRNLRRKLEPIPTHPRILLSRYGAGYRLMVPFGRGEHEELADAR